jgi:5-methylthioadenosine/S-adenosylhomocysteine deaminase
MGKSRSKNLIRNRKSANLKLMKKQFSFPLINNHTHAAMLAFRGMAEDLALDDWLNNHIWPMEKEKVTPEFVYENTKLAISEMKKNGIRAFADMYFFEDEVARAAEELEMHALIGEAIVDFPTPSCKNPEEAFEITEKLIEKYKNSKWVLVAVAPHSIYAVSEDNLIKAKDLAKKHDCIFHIHLSENKKEFDDCREKNGLTPVEYAEKLGLLDEKALLVHCVWLTDKDIEILARTRANVSHCPLSNLKLGSGIAPIHKLIDAGVNVSLGTDGAASSNRLDIWEAGKIAALLQKGVNFDPTHVPAKSAVKMMTVNGLWALGMDFWKGRNISEIEKEIDEEKDFNYLYELHAGDINFKE